MGSVVLLGLLSFAVNSPVAAGGGGGGGLPAAGNYQNSNVFANVQIFNPESQMTVQVTDTSSVSNPLGGPSTSSHEVDVYVQACDFVNEVCGAGCFIASGANDFTFSSDMTSANLTTTYTGSEAPCQGNPVAGLTPPFTVMATWTGAPGGSFSGIGRYACDRYTNETFTTGAIGSNTMATASISLLPNTAFGPAGAGLSSFGQTIHAQGTPVDSCTPLGGKGAGPGPQGLGDFTFSSQNAFLTLSPPGQPQIGVSVTSFTNVLHPRAGTITTRSETDLMIFQFYPGTIGGCFVLPAGAFTFSAGSGASLQASIDLATATPCEQSTPQGLPQSFTINATWAATGPLATLRSDGTFTCGGLTNVTSGTQTSIAATASGVFTNVVDSFDSAPASLSSNDSTFHFVRQPTC